MTPLVSVVMPARHPVPWLEQAVRSILNQDMDDFELIIVDDGSEDDAEIRRVARIDRRIRLVRQQENLGVAVALNTGIALARAPFVARMDADDIALPDRLRRQIDHLAANPNLVAVGASYACIDPNGRVFRVCYRGREPIDTRWALLTRCAILHPTLVLRREVFDIVGVYDSNLPLTQDLDLFLRLTDAGDVMVMPDILLHYRIHGNSQTRKYRNAQVQSHISILKRYWNRLELLDGRSADALASLVQSFLIGGTCGRYSLEEKIGSFQLLLEKFLKRFRPNEREELRVRADAATFLWAALFRSRNVASLCRHAIRTLQPRYGAVMFGAFRLFLRELAGLARC
ncbi:MAG: hypothetical protein KatS3mg117_3072 [Geminicoccaceae bacterium]|nr:MAG: hypothetical protein KatS3mg117_3072 [Geminicoccaceae bacterium]